MDTDYYTILNLTSICSPTEIQENYKKYAAAAHPENPSGQVLHLPGLDKSKIWELVNEAYDVLNNPETREIFDIYGEKGLKSGGSYGPAYEYHGNPMKTYNETLGIPSANGMKVKDANLEIPLPLDIRELYYGTVKTIQILRRKFNPITNKSILEEQMLILPVRPGIPAGTKFVFREEGDQGPTKIPADVVFKVKDMENKIYRREGCDLHMNYPINLIDALCGCTQPLPIRTIDDRLFNIMITEVVGPRYVKRIANEGLPMEHDHNVKGDLYIHFDIIFPAHIPVPIKDELREIIEKIPKEEVAN